MEDPEEKRGGETNGDLVFSVVLSVGVSKTGGCASVCLGSLTTSL